MMTSIIKTIENHEGESPHLKIEFVETAMQEAAAFYQRCMSANLPVKKDEVFNTAGIWKVARLLQYTCYGTAEQRVEFLNIANKIDPVRAALPSAGESIAPHILGNENVIVDTETGFSLRY